MGMAASSRPSWSFHTFIRSKKQSSMSDKNADPGLLGRCPGTGAERGVVGLRPAAEEEEEMSDEACRRCRKLPWRVLSPLRLRSWLAVERRGRSVLVDGDAAATAASTQDRNDDGPQRRSMARDTKEEFLRLARKSTNGTISGTQQSYPPLALAWSPTTASSLPRLSCCDPASCLWLASLELHEAPPTSEISPSSGERRAEQSRWPERRSKVAHLLALARRLEQAVNALFRQTEEQCRPRSLDLNINVITLVTPHIALAKVALISLSLCIIPSVRLMSSVSLRGMISSEISK